MGTTVRKQDAHIGENPTISASPAAIGDLWHKQELHVAYFDNVAIP